MSLLGMSLGPSQNPLTIQFLDPTSFTSSLLTFILFVSSRPSSAAMKGVQSKARTTRPSTTEIDCSGLISLPLPLQDKRGKAKICMALYVAIRQLCHFVHLQTIRWHHNARLALSHTCCMPSCLLFDCWLCSSLTFIIPKRHLNGTS